MECPAFFAGTRAASIEGGRAMVSGKIRDWWKRFTKSRTPFVFCCLSGIALSFCVTFSSYAGMVTGTVRQDGKPLASGRIEMRDSENRSYAVTTDRKGVYVVNLPPGIYRVTIANGHGGKENILQSSSQPSRQDLDFNGR
jgi:hypothetical protein